MPSWCLQGLFWNNKRQRVKLKRLIRAKLKKATARRALGGRRARPCRRVCPPPQPLPSFFRNGAKPSLCINMMHTAFFIKVSPKYSNSNSYITDQRGSIHAAPTLMPVQIPCAPVVAAVLELAPHLEGRGWNLRPPPSTASAPASSGRAVGRTRPSSAPPRACWRMIRLRRIDNFLCSMPHY
jgi:hypothetical protein